MVKSIEQIIQDIDNKITKYGDDYDEWYIGITNDPKERLFNDHKVDECNKCYIYRDATTKEKAEEIEKQFLKSGCKGGTGGGDKDSKFVYAYKIRSYTLQ